MASFKENIREVLYNDVRNAGHGVALFDQFLEFDAVVGSFVNSGMDLPMPSSQGTGQAIVSARVSLAPSLPELSSPPVNPPIPSPPVSSSPRPAPSEVAFLPAVPERVDTPVPEVPSVRVEAVAHAEPSPLELVHQRENQKADDRRERLGIPPSPDVVPVPEVPAVAAGEINAGASSAPPTPELPRVEIRDTGWTHDEVDDVFTRDGRPNIPLPEIPSKQPRPPIRNPTKDDPQGYKRYIDEQQSQEMGTRGVVDSMLEWQDEAHRRANTVQSLMMDFMETLAGDNNNDERRIRDMNSSLQRGRTTMTDVHI